MRVAISVFCHLVGVVVRYHVLIDKQSEVSREVSLSIRFQSRRTLDSAIRGHPSLVILGMRYKPPREASERTVIIIIKCHRDINCRIWGINYMRSAPRTVIKERKRAGGQKEKTPESSSQNAPELLRQRLPRPKPTISHVQLITPMSLFHTWMQQRIND